MSLTRDLAHLIRTKPVTSEDLESAALFVLDTLACAYGATRTPQGEILLDWHRNEPGDSRRQAFLFGSLAHVLEMDDLHRESVTHPGCVVIPAAWAVAAPKGVRGREFLRAVLYGYEAVCRIGNAVGPAHYRLWHNTATCGPFGAAFAVAALLEVDEEQIVWVLGNAGTQASGVWQFLEEGAMSKHLHAGRAAESGILAAELSARGFTGAARILEGAKGFFAAACPDALPERVTADPGGAWQLRRTSIKPWPSCRHTHPAIEAALELSRKLAVADVRAIRVETYQAALALCDNPAPATVYEAKFSLYHCVAAALTDGKVTLDSFDAGARERFADLAARIELAVSDDFEAAYPDRWGARLTIESGVGEPLVAECPVCKGDPESPLAKDEMRAKAKMLFEHGGVSGPRADALIDAVLGLPDDGPLPDIADLYA